MTPDGRIALCHFCQRAAYFAGGLNLLLAGNLERLGKLELPRPPKTPDRRFKLTADDVREIRHLHRCGMAITKIAEQYKVAATTVGNIVRRLTWRHL